jgi:hypothetical protein
VKIQLPWFAMEPASCSRFIISKWIDFEYFLAFISLKKDNDTFSYYIQFFRYKFLWKLCFAFIHGFARLSINEKLWTTVTKIEIYSRLWTLIRASATTGKPIHWFFLCNLVNYAAIRMIFILKRINGRWTVRLRRYKLISQREIVGRWIFLFSYNLGGS